MAVPHRPTARGGRRRAPCGLETLSPRPRRVPLTHAPAPARPCSFNIPVFWPILLMYFFALFFLTMKRQVKHMIKYKYVPFSFGKAKYKGKDGAEGGVRSAE